MQHGFPIIKANSVTESEGQLAEPRPVDSVVVFSESSSLLRISERITWRISTFVLVLAKCRGQAASINTIHSISWALQSSSTRSLARKWWNAPNTADLATLRMDPRLLTTLSIAAAEDLVSVTRSGRVELTERGRELGAMIDADGDLLVEEKALLRDLAPLNDRQVSARLGGVEVVTQV